MELFCVIQGQFAFSILAMIYACVGRTQYHICLPAVSSSLCCVVPVFIDVFSFMALRWISLILLDLSSLGTKVWLEQRLCAYSKETQRRSVKTIVADLISHQENVEE